MHYVCPTKALLKPCCFKLYFGCMEKLSFSTFNYCIFTQRGIFFYSNTLILLATFNSAWSIIIATIYLLDGAGKLKETHTQKGEERD